jgi:hypothetical protein
MVNADRNQMVSVIDWQISAEGNQQVGVLETGVQTITVNATLLVNDKSANPSDFYTGNYVITFDYN